MSFGIAEREHQDQNADELLHCADLAMYEAKATSRNRVRYYTYGDVKSFTADRAVAGFTSQPQVQVEGFDNAVQWSGMQAGEELKRGTEQIENVTSRGLSAKTPPIALYTQRSNPPSQLPAVVPSAKSNAPATAHGQKKTYALAKFNPNSKNIPNSNT